MIVSPYIVPSPDVINVSITIDPLVTNNSGNGTLLCVNSTIKLICDTDSLISMVEHYQWLSSQEHEEFYQGLAEIEVVLRPYPVIYTCVVTNDYDDVGYSNISIVSNGEWHWCILR